MALGFKDFTAGNILTDSDMDGIMRQTIMSFASASARNTALSGVLEEGMHAWLQDNNQVTYYTGSAWRTIYQPETAWTPSWTNLTVGNGTQTALYCRSGDLVQVQLQLTFGTTTSISGSVSIGNLPVTGSVSAQAVSCHLIDASASDALGMARIATGSVTLKSSAGANINATTPFTWTTSDQIIFAGTYIAA